MSLSTIVVQSILIFFVATLAILLQALPQGKKSQNLPLSLFLGIISIHVFVDLTFDTPIFGNLKVHLLPSVFIFLYAPLLWFHASAVLGVQRKNRLWHIAPSAAFLLLYAFTGFRPDIFFPAFGIQYAIYIVLATRMTLMEGKTAKKIARIWVFFLVYSFGLIWFFAFAANIFGGLGYEGLADQVELVSYMVSICFLVGLAYFTMSQPNLFMNVRLSKSSQELSAKSLSEEDTHQVKQIRELFEVDKIYQDPELNREKLANRLGVDVQVLSKMVNQHFKMNLSELINQYRIKEAKELLGKGDISIKEVFYEVGFNSRSAFNNAFKKMVGTAPSEYRKAENKMS